MPRLKAPAVADVNLEAAHAAFRLAQIPNKDVIVCENTASAKRALEMGKRVIVQDASLLIALPLDVISIATRVPKVAAQYAYEAIESGKHVVMTDKEADSAVGPILKYLADKQGLVLTTDFGDQPGVLMGLVSWAKSLGLEILIGRNILPTCHMAISANRTGLIPDTPVGRRPAVHWTEFAEMLCPV